MLFLTEHHQAEMSFYRFFSSNITEYPRSYNHFDDVQMKF